MATTATVGSARVRSDEEAFLWATSSLGLARREGRRRSAALFEAVVEELAFDLGAGDFPPAGARATRVFNGRATGARRR